MNTSSIIKVERLPKNELTAPFDARAANNPVLSWRAKGVLFYILGKPDYWQVRISDLIDASPDGKYVVKSIFRELKKAGHAELRTFRSKKGKFWGKQWIIFERPKGGFVKVKQTPTDHSIDRRETGRTSEKGSADASPSSFVTQRRGQLSLDATPARLFDQAYSPRTTAEHIVHEYVNLSNKKGWHFFSSDRPKAGATKKGWSTDTIRTWVKHAERLLNKYGKKNVKLVWSWWSSNVGINKYAQTAMTFLTFCDDFERITRAMEVDADKRGLGVLGNDRSNGYVECDEEEITDEEIKRDLLRGIGPYDEDDFVREAHRLGLTKEQIARAFQKRRCATVGKTYEQRVREES